MNWRHITHAHFPFWALLGATALALALGLFVGATVFEKTIVVREGTPNTPAAMSSVNLMIDYGDGVVRTWNTVSWHEAMSVMGLLETIAAAKEITLITKEDGAGGPVVESIGDMSNDREAALRWQYWINNTHEPRIASKYYLKPGDIVVWKYVKEQVR